jgi:hypothetical protein
MARFWNSRPQEFVSQFVPENLEIQQGYFDDLQKNQDAYKLKIEGLNKQTDALVNDIPGAIESKKRLESRIGGLREVNYNDPIQREQALKGIREFQYELSPFGELGARDKKKKEYDAFQKELDERYKSNPMMKSYMTKKLKEENLNPERAIKFENGNPVNTEIVPPKEFTYKDKNDEFTKWLKDTEFDQISQNSGLSKEEGHAALYNYMSGNIQEKKGEKIYNALKSRALADGNLIESLKAEANYFYNDESKADAILEEALKGVVTGGKFKRTNLDVKYLEDGVEAHGAKNKIDNPQFTLFNESAVVPGEKTDYKTVSGNITSTKQQLAALPPEGSANDNYQTKIVREQLNKKLKIAENFMNTGRTRFYDSEDGKKALDTLYDRVSTKGFKDANRKESEELAPHLKSKEAFYAYMKNKNSALKDQLEDMTGLKNNLSDYIEKNPVSYSAKVLTGSEKSSVGLVNKELTERVDKNGTNYYTVDGTDLNAWKEKNLDEGDKMEVAVMDDDLGGQFAQYMTIRDKDGKIKSEMPIYPKDGGRQEQGYIGRKLLEENKSQADPLEKENYNRGAKMLANSMYGDQISQELLESYIPRLQNNSSVGVNVPVSLNVNGGKFDGEIKMKKQGNVVSYELRNKKGESLMQNGKPINSIDDLKVSLLGL